jgi:hypothetical protein
MLCRGGFEAVAPLSLMNRKNKPAEKNKAKIKP